MNRARRTACSSVTDGTHEGWGGDSGRRLRPFFFMEAASAAQEAPPFFACGERAGFLRGGERALVEIADEVSDIAKGDFL